MLSPPASLTRGRYKSEGDLLAATAARRPVATASARSGAERGSLRDQEVFSRVSVKALVRHELTDLT